MAAAVRVRDVEGLLVVGVTDQRVGLRVRDVVEVLAMVHVEPLPRAPEVVEGVIDVRGMVVPVLDIRRRFGFAPGPARLDDRLVVVETAGRRVALHVGATADLVDVDTITPVESDDALGISRLPDGLVVVHDVGAFLASDEIVALDAALEELTERSEGRGDRGRPSEPGAERVRGRSPRGPMTVDTADDVDVVAGWLQATVGVRVDGHQAARVHGRVRDRMHAERCRDGHEYLARVTGDAGARDALLDAVAVGETYFLRDERQMALLREEVLPALRRGPAGRVVDVWSAGCASGEEAYTIAALAHEAFPAVPVRVLGTDVSPAAIRHATDARYGHRSLRTVDEQHRRTWFQQDGDAHVVRPAVRDRARFRVANLLEPIGERFDLVVCRNVLIYLSASAIRRVAENLLDALRPGGFLLTGASDPPVVHPDLEVLRTPYGLVQRRCDGAPAPAPLAPLAAVPNRRAAPPPQQPAARRTPSPQPRPQPQPPEPPSPEPAHQRIRRLADEGRHDEALAEARQAISCSPLDPALRYLTALLHLAAGQPSAAAGAARSALYLAPDLAVAHLALGRAELARGNRSAATRSFRAAARELERLAPDGEVPLGDGQPAGHLATVAAQLADTRGDPRAR